MHYIISVCIFFALNTYAHSMNIEADSVSYEENAIVLEGNVSLSTEQFLIKAKRARVNKEEGGESTRYFIYGDVVTTIPEKWVLYSDTMTINEQMQQIHAVSEEGKKVHLQSIGDDQLDLVSKQLTMHWEDQKSNFIIRQLTATKKVKVSIPSQNMKIISDRVVYREKSSTTEEPRISFYDEGSCCRMEVIPFLSIDSSQIVYYPLQEKTFFIQASGILSLDQESLQPSFWEFSSNKMEWDQKRMALQLQGDVLAYNPEGYRLSTENATIYGKECNKNFFCHLFSCPDKTELSIDDAGGSKVLISPCGAELDFSVGKGVLNTDLTEPGNPSLQCYFYSQGECFFSDHVNLKFNPESTKLTHILADGNAYLRHKNPNNQTHLVADHIAYDIYKDSMLINSDADRQVLYYDQSSNIAMSAPSVSYEQDENNSTPEIRGNGDVKMILSTESSLFWKDTINKYQNIYAE